ncbi:MAG: hypothetical protein AABO41_04490 [Acidobacteriota bacterium]
MPEAQIGERADEVAHRLVRIYEIHEIIIAETGGSLACGMRLRFMCFDCGRELTPVTR